MCGSRITQWVKLQSTFRCILWWHLHEGFWINLPSCERAQVELKHVITASKLEHPKLKIESHEIMRICEQFLWSWSSPYENVVKACKPCNACERCNVCNNQRLITDDDSSSAIRSMFSSGSWSRMTFKQILGMLTGFCDFFLNYLAIVLKRLMPMTNWRSTVATFSRLRIIRSAHNETLQSIRARAICSLRQAHHRWSILSTSQLKSSNFDRSSQFG